MRMAERKVDGQCFLITSAIFLETFLLETYKNTAFTYKIGMDLGKLCRLYISINVEQDFWKLCGVQGILCSVEFYWESQSRQRAPAC